MRTGDASFAKHETQINKLCGQIENAKDEKQLCKLVGKLALEVRAVNIESGKGVYDGCVKGLAERAAILQQKVPDLLLRKETLVNDKNKKVLVEDVATNAAQSFQKILGKALLADKIPTPLNTPPAPRVAAKEIPVDKKRETLNETQGDKKAEKFNALADEFYAKELDRVNTDPSIKKVILSIPLEDRAVIEPHIVALFEGITNEDQKASIAATIENSSNRVVLCKTTASVIDQNSFAEDVVKMISFLANNPESLKAASESAPLVQKMKSYEDKLALINVMAKVEGYNRSNVSNAVAPLIDENTTQDELFDLVQHLGRSHPVASIDKYSAPLMPNMKTFADKSKLMKAMSATADDYRKIAGPVMASIIDINTPAEDVIAVVETLRLVDCNQKLMNDANPFLQKMKDSKEKAKFISTMATLSDRHKQSVRSALASLIDQNTKDSDIPIIVESLKYTWQPEKVIPDVTPLMTNMDLNQKLRFINAAADANLHRIVPAKFCSLVSSKAEPSATADQLVAIAEEISKNYYSYN